MKKQIRCSAQTDALTIDHIKHEGEQKLVDKIYDEVRTLVSDMETISDSTYVDLEMNKLYQPMLDYLQDNYKFYGGI